MSHDASYTNSKNDYWSVINLKLLYVQMIGEDLTSGPVSICLMLLAFSVTSRAGAAQHSAIIPQATARSE